MKKLKKAAIALLLTFIIAAAPITPFAQPIVVMAAEEDEPFVLYLTEEARDLVLYDFDFLISVIRENTAWVSVINRRLDIDFDEHVASMRQAIYNMEPLVFLRSLEAFEELMGTPMYEIWFPIRDNDDPRYIAANFIGYFLLSWFGPFESIGHLFPRELSSYRLQYSWWRIFSHQGGNLSSETNPHGLLLYETYTHPDVRWFYGPVEVDLYADTRSVFPEVADNIEIEIIVPGEIAYLRINSFRSSAEYDDLIIAPFFEEISDFDHLIIDIRGNSGGFVFNFIRNILGRLINEPVVSYSHQFFSGGEIAVAAMNAYVVTTQYIFDGVQNNAVNQWYTINVLPVREFIYEQGMTAFNQDDLEYLEYVVVERDWFFPTDDIYFGGKVWLLIDEYTASASSQATLLLMEQGLATVVGENTSGIMSANSIYLILPNTGLLFRVDLGYRTDAQGNSLEVYGIAPDIRNHEGLDALQTVLGLIGNYDVHWMRRGVPPWGTTDFTGHPLVGNWVWDRGDDYIYELRPDGTGIRGFAFNRYEITWYAYGTYLFIDNGFETEQWSFKILDGTLTIVCTRTTWRTWRYIRQ